MKIIINETEKAYNLTMQEWTGNSWGPDMAGDIILDSSFAWDEDCQAYRMDGSLDNLIGYLHNWDQYKTEADLDAYDEYERERLRNDRPRSYDLDEINE